jgi:uncharacterized membrane protein
MKDFLQGKWLGHPLHPAVVHLPTALWPAALFFDLLSYTRWGGNVAVQISFYAVLLGVIFAALAVPFGVADWWDIRKEKPAWKIAVFHMLLNSIALAVWSLNLGLRASFYQNASQVPLLPLVLSILGVLILAVSGYLGGRMVFAYGVSVARLSKEKWRSIAEKGGGRTAK